MKRLSATITIILTLVAVNVGAVEKYKQIRIFIPNTVGEAPQTWVMVARAAGWLACRSVIRVCGMSSMFIPCIREMRVTRGKTQNDYR